MHKDLFLNSGRRPRFSVDSRNISPGDVYCALPGAKVNGEDFVEEALKKGASYAFVSNKYRKQDKRLIVVEDVLSILQMLAKEILKQKRPKHVIGITGSIGKTTTKEFLSTLLEEAFSVFKTPENANSQIGLPLAVINGFKGQDVAVIEMGMTHPGEIEKLASIAMPDIALITQIALVHAENFSSLEEIAQAKGEIFLHDKTDFKICPYEFRESFNYKTLKTFSLEDSKADYHFNDFPFIPHFPVHLQHNLLAALCIASRLGISPENLQKQIEKLSLPKMRMQKIEKKGVFFINDSYNAAPDSMIAALKSLPAGKKRIAVFGQMTELGKFSEECHQKVALEALLHVDHLVCFGDLCAPMLEVWRKASRSCVHFFDHDEIVSYLKKLVNPGDVVLLKGSNSTKMWTVLDKF